MAFSKLFIFGNFLLVGGAPSRDSWKAKNPSAFAHIHEALYGRPAVVRADKKYRKLHDLTNPETGSTNAFYESEISRALSGSENSPNILKAGNNDPDSNNLTPHIHDVYVPNPGLVTRAAASDKFVDVKKVSDALVPVDGLHRIKEPEDLSATKLDYHVVRDYQNIYDLDPNLEAYPYSHLSVPIFECILLKKASLFKRKWQHIDAYLETKQANWEKTTTHLLDEQRSLMLVRNFTGPISCSRDQYSYVWERLEQTNLQFHHKGVVQDFREKEAREEKEAKKRSTSTGSYSKNLGSNVRDTIQSVFGTGQMGKYLSSMYSNKKVNTLTGNSLKHAFNFRDSRALTQYFPSLATMHLEWGQFLGKIGYQLDTRVPTSEKSSSGSRTETVAVTGNDAPILLKEQIVKSKALAAQASLAQGSKVYEKPTADELYPFLKIRKQLREMKQYILTDMYDLSRQKTPLRVLMERSVSLIVEVGSYHGHSAIRMARVLDLMGLRNVPIICVDPFVSTQDVY